MLGSIAKIRENLGILLFHRGEVVTRIAIVRNGSPVRAHVAAIMAPEAARKIHVPQIVRIRAPGDLHLRKHVAQINGLHRVLGVFDVGSAALIELRVIGLVKLVQVRCDLARGRIAIRLLAAQRGDGFLLDER